MKKLAILGSTGSIGRSTLKIVSLHPDRFDVEVLAAAHNVFLLSEQIKQFNPKTVVVMTEEGAFQLKTLLKGEKCPEILIISINNNSRGSGIPSIKSNGNGRYKTQFNITSVHLRSSLLSGRYRPFAM